MKATNNNFASHISAGEKKIFAHNAKIVYIQGKSVTTVNEMSDKSWALCKWWMNIHKNDPQYSRGQLAVVSVLENKYKEKTGIKLCPNCNQAWDGIECKSCSFDTAFDPNWSKY